MATLPDASSAAPNPSTPCNPPLTWQEARHRLRSFLTDYINDTPSTLVVRRKDVSTTHKSKFGARIVSWWMVWDLDVYLGAMGSSMALLIIAAMAHANGGLPMDGEPSLPSSYLRSQLAASVLVVLGGLINAWFIYRRRYSDRQGSDTLKRREISQFLQEIEEQESECLERSQEHPGADFDASVLELSGTSITDIYPVYRRRVCHGGQVEGGAWSRIPTLLLVQGDHIALQIGDIAPAGCRLMETHPSTVELEAGEIITLVTFGETSTLTAGKWPRGRTTLPRDSDKLLTLCNNLRLFEVLETPLESFLREPRVESRKPQIIRQLEAIRVVLSGMGIALFVATLVILFSRIDTTSQELAMALPVPFLVAVAAFPLTGPVCLIFIEALGTARILAAYHPVATLRQDSSGTSANLDLLLFRYFLATVSNRLSLQDFGRKVTNTTNAICQLLGASEKLSVGPNLVRVPPASLNLLEKLGVATAFTLVDDELVCEPQPVPQQLLIPSEKGLKLLDICPTYEDESDDESESDGFNNSRRSNDEDFQDSDSDSDVGLDPHHHVPSRQKRRRLLQKAHRESVPSLQPETDDGSDAIEHEVQFEDPLWWQHLPSLKCIGLACLLVDDKNKNKNTDIRNMKTNLASSQQSTADPQTSTDLQACKRSLIRHISVERRSMQLRSLAQCIGFSTQPNGQGKKGDISPFVEKHRMHIINSSRVKERLEIDSHERDSEESRWWGLLRPDSTSVIVQDTRSGSYQLLTVGDPRVVTRMCNEAWQGENSTILPLTVHDRNMILETSNGWRLGDMDCEAFSYAPIAHSFDERCGEEPNANSRFYLLENEPRSENAFPTLKDKSMGGEWPLLQNQIFLGVLGSLIIPRQETQGLLSTLQDAGARFVFMSPRNMRLTKETASQMGIDIAWNAAISLRPLDEGQEDKHRMISNYADWDVNAKLPHGIESVKRHLNEVDNVPLLVSLFTDVTKLTAKQMIETFQEYNDTVIAVGLSHLPLNSGIFSAADLGIGIDVLPESLKRSRLDRLGYNSMLPSEVMFVSAISAHACAFRLRGVESIAYMPTILAQGRTALEAATAATLFVLCGCLSFSFYILFSVCSVATAIPLPEIMSAFLALQVILPLLGLPMTMSDPDKQCMLRVPAKNDLSITFGKKEGKTLLVAATLKAILPAVFPQLLYLIAFGELMIDFEAELVEKVCQPGLGAGDWTTVIRCQELGTYTGVARRAAATLAMGEFLLCILVASAGFVHRTLPLYVEPPWRRNAMWVTCMTVAILTVGLYLGLKLEEGTFAALPWYFFILALLMPFLCLAWVEHLKRSERFLLDRNEKLRRLQFETRLGMWSPK